MRWRNNEAETEKNIEDNFPGDAGADEEEYISEIDDDSVDDFEKMEAEADSEGLSDCVPMEECSSKAGSEMDDSEDTIPEDSSRKKIRYTVTMIALFCNLVDMILVGFIPGREGAGYLGKVLVDTCRWSLQTPPHYSHF